MRKRLFSVFLQLTKHCKILGQRLYNTLVLACVMVVALCAATPAFGASRRYTLQTMKRVFDYAASVDTTSVGRMKTYAYVKYDIRTNKRNGILLVIPTMFAVANGGDREHVGETYSRVDNANPDNFSATRLLERSTIPYEMRTMPTVLKFLTPFIYDEMLIDGRIVSPFHYRNRRFYR